MQSIRIYEMPKCKMVTSGTGMFGDANIDSFNKWFSTFPRTQFPKDYLFFDGKGFVWLYMYDEDMNVPDEFEIIDFEGGLYAVYTDIDQKTDIEANNKLIEAFLSENGFEIDTTRFQLGNVITPPSAQKIFGYCQMDYYTPIKSKN